MNKEIENILDKCAPYLFGDELDKLLSYIEQLEKRNKELYEGFMATQEELTDYATKNEQLENENKQLKKQKDDVVEYINNNSKNISITKESKKAIPIEELLRILGEIE